MIVGTHVSKISVIGLNKNVPHFSSFNKTYYAYTQCIQTTDSVRYVKETIPLNRRSYRSDYVIIYRTESVRNTHSFPLHHSQMDLKLRTNVLTYAYTSHVQFLDILFKNVPHIYEFFFRVVPCANLKISHQSPSL